MTRAELPSYINQQRYGVVSSIGANGTPQSALVGIAATSKLEIVFDTLSNTRKYANLRERPACSLVIGWANERTLHLEGEAWFPAGQELLRLREEYLAHWPDGRDRLQWPRLVHIAVRPRWIRFSNYDVSPPLMQEFSNF